MSCFVGEMFYSNIRFLLLTFPLRTLIRNAFANYVFAFVVSLFYSTVVTATVLTCFPKAARRRHPVRGNLGWRRSVALHISREVLRFRAKELWCRSTRTSWCCCRRRWRSCTAVFQNFALEDYENVQVRMSDCSPHCFLLFFFP